MTTLQKAIDALQSGQTSAALGHLKTALSENPSDPAAWVWLARAVEDPAKKRECLQRALRLDPQNKFAQKTLDELEGRSTPPPSAPAAPAPAPAPASPGRTLRPQVPVQKINDAMLTPTPAPAPATPAATPQPTPAPQGGVLLGGPAEQVQPPEASVFHEPETGPLPMEGRVFSQAAPTASSASPAAFTLSSSELTDYINSELVEPEPRPEPAPIKRAPATPVPPTAPAPRRHPRRGPQPALILLLILLVLAAVAAWVFFLR